MLITFVFRNKKITIFEVQQKIKKWLKQENNSFEILLILTAL